MSDWLLKTEPSEYSFEDFVKERKTVWTGVKNPVAKRHLFEMKPGERIVVYHTGNVKAAVGLASVVSSSSDSRNPGEPSVVIAAGTALKKPVTLEAVKGSPLFSESPLVRIGRLSVVPLTAAQYRFFAGA